MILFLDAITQVEDLVIDYIEVGLSNETTVSLNWDTSYIDRDETWFSATYKGLYFDEEYANGRIDELQGMRIFEVGLYTETQAPATISITKMEFEDGEKRLSFTMPYQSEKVGLENTCSQNKA